MKLIVEKNKKKKLIRRINLFLLLLVFLSYLSLLFLSQSPLDLFFFFFKRRVFLSIRFFFYIYKGLKKNLFQYVPTRFYIDYPRLFFFMKRRREDKKKLLRCKQMFFFCRYYTCRIFKSYFLHTEQTFEGIVFQSLLYWKKRAN